MKLFDFDPDWHYWVSIWDARKICVHLIAIIFKIELPIQILKCLILLRISFSIRPDLLFFERSLSNDCFFLISNYFFIKYHVSSEYRQSWLSTDSFSWYLRIAMNSLENGMFSQWLEFRVFLLLELQLSKAT